MSEHKTVFGKIFGWIGDIFHNSAEKLWDGLSSEEQAGIKNGSGIIAIINKHIGDAPEVIVDAIKAEFPDVDFAVLTTGLLTICETLNIELPSVDINGAIEGLKTYLASKEGTIWEWASSSLAQLLSVIFTPNQTVFAKISMLVEFAYQTFIKIKNQ